MVDNDQAMAAPLGEGALSALNYGNKLTALATALGATSLGTTILPHLAHMAQAGQWSALRHTLRTFVRYTLLATLIACLLGIAGSQWIVHLLFERGQFSPDNTQLVAAVQRWSLLQVPMYIVGVVGVRMLSALEQNQLLLRIGLMNVVTNFALDWLLRAWLGLPGIAAASAGVYLISGALVFRLVGQELQAAEQSAGRQPAIAEGQLEHDALVERRIEPGIGADFVLQLSCIPAGVAKRDQPTTRPPPFGDRLQNLYRRRQRAEPLNLDRSRTFPIGRV